MCAHTFRRLRGILCNHVSDAGPKVMHTPDLTIRKQNIQLEQPTLPQCLVLAGHPTLPFLQVQNSLRCADGFCEETEWVIATPLLPLRRDLLALL